MTLVRWEPFRDLSLLQGRFNRLFNDSLFHDAGEDGVQAWSPAVDIFEQGDDLILRAEVTGVKADDLDVKVDGNVLTLRGQRKREESIAEENYHRVERHYGAFTRSFTLPSSVDGSAIKARYQDGILEVVLPKAEEAKPRRIEVKAS